MATQEIEQTQQTSESTKVSKRQKKTSKDLTATDISWNCQVLATHEADLKILQEQEKPDLLCLQETWLKQGKPVPFNLPNYFFYRADREEGRVQGQSSFNLKKNLHFPISPL